MKYTSTNPCKSINWCQIILKRKEGKSSNETAYMVFKVSRQNRLQVASLGVWSFVMFLGMKSKHQFDHKMRAIILFKLFLPFVSNLPLICF